MRFIGLSSSPFRTRSFAMSQVVLVQFKTYVLGGSVLIQAIAVVPEPMQLSKTVSPSFGVSLDKILKQRDWFLLSRMKVLGTIRAF